MKIGRKLALWIISILLTVSVAAAYLFYTAKLREEAGELEMFGRITGGVIEESLITYMQRRDMPGLAKKMEDVQKTVGNISGIMLLNKDGVAKVGTDKQTLGRVFSLHDAGCRECHEQGNRGPLVRDGSTYRWASPVENKQECHACHPASAKNNGVLIIDFSIAEFQRNARREILTAYGIFGLSLIAIGAVMVFLAKVLITRRLERMGAAMLDFQRGGPSVLTPVEGHDEITRLETGFNAMAQAITVREQDKDALVRTVNEQLQFLQLLIDTIPMPVFYKDVNGVYRGYNKAFAEFLGLTKDNLIGKTVYDVAPRELADKYYQMDKELFDNPGVQKYEYPVKHADGTVHEVLFNKATYTDAEGKVAGLVGAMPDITERKRLEQKLAQRESHLRAIIDTEPECVMLVAADGTLLEMNPAGLTMLEADSFEQVEGVQFSSLVVPEHRSAFEELAGKTFRGESGMLEFEMVGFKGARRWLETYTAPLWNAQGQAFALLGVARDITGRKKAEQVIRRNYDAQTAINWILHISLENLSLESILKQTLDLILSIPWLSIEAQGSIFLVENDPDKLIMKAQRGLSDYLKEECRVVPFGKCLCGRAAARGEVQFADSLDERHEVSYEGIEPHGHYCVPIIRAKSVLGVINLYLKEGHQRDRREIEFLSSIADALAGIIQRKGIEVEREKLIGDLRNVLGTVSRSQKEWQDTFDSITDMISIVDRDFTILRANRAFSKYYGLQPQDVIGKKCYKIIHDGDSPIPNCPHRTTMAERKSSGEEVFDKRTKKMFHIFTFPYNSPEGEGIASIHIMRDITDDKEKEMRLIMSERLATLGQMASGIAHEINNPLASIAGCSEGLLSRVRKGQCDMALFESYLGIIQEEVFRCKSITTAMLSFVRKATYEKKDIDLAEALDKTIEIIGFQGRLKNIEIIRNYHESAPVIRGNEGELRQVILIVITNALDAMQDKGVLTIETDSAEGRAIIRISDTGEGIPPEIINRIFDPFFTTKSDKGGTGLGLSIARKIVGNYNGDIEATSTPGKGTTFSITFPQ